MSAAAIASPLQIAPPAPVLRPLGQLLAGQVGSITEVVVEETDARRLKALGLCVGRTVRMVSAGNPLIVQVLGSRVGLSAVLAAQVNVEAC